MEIVAMGFWLIPSIDHDGCGHDPGYNLLAGPPQGIVIIFFFQSKLYCLCVQPGLQIKHLARIEHESESCLGKAC